MQNTQRPDITANSQKHALVSAAERMADINLILFVLFEQIRGCDMEMSCDSMKINY
jgi:hypothetical protein